MSTSIARKPGFLKEINVLDNKNHNQPGHLNAVIDNTISHSPGYLKNYLDLEIVTNPKPLVMIHNQRVQYMRPNVGRFNGNPGVLKKFGRNPRYN